jgi:hypothetical protein
MNERIGHWALSSRNATIHAIMQILEDKDRERIENVLKL